MDTNELKSRKLELERNIHNTIKAELDRFAEDTGLGIREIRFDLLVTTFGKVEHELSAIECEIEI